MSHKASADVRTCAVCSAQVAPELQGYLGSIRACEAHLTAWRDSPVRMSAAIEAMRGERQALPQAFEQWVQSQAEAGGVA